MAKSMSECLEEAACLIEKDGWAQGMFGRGKQPHCMIGAVVEACPAVNKDDAARALGFRTSYGAFKWNDLGYSFSRRKTKLRTKEEVLARLRAGAEKARVKEVQAAQKAEWDHNNGHGINA